MPRLRWILLLATCLGATMSWPAAAPAQRAVPIAMSGRVIPADGGSVAGLRVFVRAGSFAGSAAVDPLGRFSLPLPADLVADTVEIRVDAAGPGVRGYHAALVRLADEEFSTEQSFVVVPTSWTIRGGTYDGRRVEIDLRRAFEAACPICPPFYRHEANTGAPTARGMLKSWPEDVFPIRIAFDREFSSEPITARDSTAFWRTVDRMEATFGGDFFRPATYTETLPVDFEGPYDVILVWADPELEVAGLGTIVSRAGVIEYGAVRLKRASMVSRPEGSSVVVHELLHTLGFGHTCAWRSVMAEADRCWSRDSRIPTAEDVAYVQLFRQVRTLQQVHAARWGIDAAEAALY